MLTDYLLSTFYAFRMSVLGALLHRSFQKAVALSCSHSLAWFFYRVRSEL